MGIIDYVPDKAKIYFFDYYANKSFSSSPQQSQSQNMNTTGSGIICLMLRVLSTLITGGLFLKIGTWIDRMLFFPIIRKIPIVKSWGSQISAAAAIFWGTTGVTLGWADSFGVVTRIESWFGVSSAGSVASPEATAKGWFSGFFGSK